MSCFVVYPLNLCVGNSIDKSLESLLGSSHVGAARFFFFFAIYEETVKEWGWGFKKLKGISFSLSSTQQWHHVNNSTTIYLVEWKIAAAILVVNNPFSHSREPLPGQHLLSDFMIKLIKTVLFNSIFQRKIMPPTGFYFLIFFFDQNCSLFLKYVHALTWNLEIQNKNIWSFPTLLLPHSPPPPHPLPTQVLSFFFFLHFLGEHF